MKITMIGMGAVGAVVGKRLGEFLGFENMECIADSQRKSRYEKNGISINGERINFHFVTPENAGKSDLVIIATKNLQLKDVLVQIEKAIGPETTILSLLNGIQSEQELSEKFGKEKVLYGYIVNLSSTNENGNITCGHEGTIYFGEDSNEITPRVSEIKKLFDNAKVNHLSQWKKFLLNVSCNTISALCRQTYKGFRNEITQDVVRQCAREVVADARKKGIALTDEMIEENIRMTSSLNDEGKTSMLQDVEAKRRTENDYFCGTIVKLGKELGIQTPVCDLLHKLINALNLHGISFLI